MGTYTTNYKLLKAGDGTVDPVDDYVDVVSQLDRNLNLIDDFGFKACEYKVFNDVSSENLPMTGYRAGDKLFSDFDQSIKVWTGSDWSNTKASGPVWQDSTINSGFENFAGTSNTCGYYVDSSSTVNLRGMINRTSMAIWVQGSAVAVFPAGAFPSPSLTKTLFTMGGVSTTRQAQMYYVVVATNGSATITKYGPNAQTAGSAENYVSLEGLSYALS